jgi:prepilin-type N-terminal cleavage/methylation domain-containing protein
MTIGRAHEEGDTLIEILISIVVLGIVASAAFLVISIGATTSKGQRDFVTADALLRNSAEATKAAVRKDCSTGGSFSVAYSALPAPDPAQTWLQYYQVTRDFILPADIANRTCPAPTEAPVIALSVTLPDGTLRPLSIAVRAP